MEMEVTISGDGLFVFGLMLLKTKTQVRYIG